MNRRLSSLGALAAAAALAVPAVAVAKGESKKDRVKRNSIVTHVLHGTVSSVDGESSTALVEVTKANRHARDLVGEELSVKVSERALVVDDLNGDGDEDFSDVEAGHHVLVQVRAPRRERLEDSVVARKFVDLEEAAADREEADEAKDEDDQTRDDSLRNRP